MGRKRFTIDMSSLLPIVGQISVGWKHEDTIRGVAYGPVVITDKEAFAAWKAKHNITGVGIPFGSKPDGMHKLESWLSQKDAERVAKHYGVTLEVR